VSLARLVGILALLVAIVLWISNGLDEIGFGDFRSFGFGFVRVGYPFFAGVLIFRSGLFARLPRLPPVVVAAALFAFLMSSTLENNVPAVIVAVILVVPALVAFGANARATARIWTYLGRLSYPFYVLHQPILRVVARQRITGTAGWISALLGIILAGVAAHAALLLYDEPVRRWLQKRAFRTESKASRQAVVPSMHL
jgi:peptidoglycan/LPS O-acetylase OafA/YrhL